MEFLSTKISYTRLLLIFFSWYFVTDQPEVFIGIQCAQHLLYVLQQAFLPPQKDTGDDVIPSGAEDDESKQEPELNKQLRILITRLSTSILIFAVIRQSLDHARHKAEYSKGPSSATQEEDPLGVKVPSIDSKT